MTDYFDKAGPARSISTSSDSRPIGYGCTTCIGNTGPLPEHDRARRSKRSDLVVAAVLSGNRNFEGRINPHVKANYLAIPPLVVAYALAGTVDIDLTDRAARHGQATASRSI